MLLGSIYRYCRTLLVISTILTVLIIGHAVALGYSGLWTEFYGDAVRDIKRSYELNSVI